MFFSFIIFFPFSNASRFCIVKITFFSIPNLLYYSAMQIVRGVSRQLCPCEQVLCWKFAQMPQNFVTPMKCATRQTFKLWNRICVFTNINLDAYVIVCVATVIVVNFCVEKCVMCLCIVCMCVLESLES